VNQRFEAGEFIKFTYNPPPKALPKLRPGQPPPPVSDHNKEVLVLHPGWQGKVHAIDLKRITPAEVQVLKSIFDPKVKAAIDAGQWPVDGVPPYPLIRDILHRYDPNELIKNPIAAYQALVKPFIRNKDCYRLYFPQFMGGVQVIQESNVPGHVTNPRPLFHK